MRAGCRLERHAFAASPVSWFGTKESAGSRRRRMLWTAIVRGPLYLNPASPSLLSRKMPSIGKHALTSEVLPSPLMLFVAVALIAP